MPKISAEDAMRYLGAARAGADVRTMVEKTAEEMERAITPRYVFRGFALIKARDGFLLPGAGMVLSGETAQKMLQDCETAVLLLCTLGAAFDARLRAAQARDMARAVVWDACGSACVEAGCDAAEEEIAARHPGFYLTDRFSPGYGDLPLTLQSALVSALNGEKRLGVQVTETHLLIPSKTVTAVIGLSRHPQRARIRGCAYCNFKNACALRKGGGSCAL